MLGDAPGYLLRDRALLSKTTLFQASIFLLDATTLWAMLRAVGQNVSFLAAFPSFMVASMYRFHLRDPSRGFVDNYLRSA